MCSLAFYVNAVSREQVQLVTVCASYNPSLPHERHKAPIKKAVMAFREGEDLMHLYNAPVGGRVSIYDGLGKLLDEEEIHASDCCVLLPVSAETIELSYGSLILRGNLNFK